MPGKDKDAGAGVYRSGGDGGGRCQRRHIRSCAGRGNRDG